MKLDGTEYNGIHPYAMTVNERSKQNLVAANVYTAGHWRRHNGAKIVTAMKKSELETSPRGKAAIRNRVNSSVRALSIEKKQLCYKYPTCESDQLG
ncbi:hypothetical protein M514_03331 [Trichuris suis]|uniref:Uncharacterized protein n=1 Tax=Trichuris suis TaxID=68888 RepID=A0A085NL83_9BILA|nr:hypothetical protein M513_03331 [Trichuris suis]KFD70229.1 hypothetical protein M514_03331 [Trichuris suis]